MKIYIICPVRDGVPSDVGDYVCDMEAKGHSIHFPPRDVDQDDETGINIVVAHKKAMEWCEEVHIFWDVKSCGSHFDLGMAIALGKRIKMVKEYQEDISGKSYSKVIKILENN